MKKLLSALFLAFTIAASGQTDPKEAIIQLKEGTLIVKLIKQQKKIDLLLKQGKKEEAIAFEKEEKIQNEAIIQAFSTTYSFSKLLFIYATDMGKLADGDPSVLFDKEGKPANEIPMKYLFVELGETPITSNDGFIVRDQNNDMLNKPFPYFTRQRGFLNLSIIPFPTMVEKWQKKLNNYYASVIK